jgi:hypothetical protein
MKTRILPLLLLVAVFGVTGSARAQEQPPQQTPPNDPPAYRMIPASYQQLPGFAANGTANGAANGAAPGAGTGTCTDNGCGNSCGYGSCGGTCLERLAKWLCYRPLVRTSCDCGTPCRCCYYPSLYQYFLPASAFTGEGVSPGCQNCWNSRR